MIDQNEKYELDIVNLDITITIITITITYDIMLTVQL